MPLRATLRVSGPCSNRCVFCASPGASHGLSMETVADVDRVAARASLPSLRALSDELTLVGGEPTLVEELPAIVAAARAAGFVRVGLQTNGLRLAEHADALAAEGLTDVHLSLHGAEARVHDHHTGMPGSFATVERALAAARSAGLVRVVSTVLTRSNFRVLTALPSLLLAHGVAAWALVLPHAAGAAASAFDRVMPRVGLAMPFALHALSGAERLGLVTFVDGAPLCALGPLAHHALTREPRAYGRDCESCAARAACPGLDRAYLERFGGDELHARALPTVMPQGARTVTTPETSPLTPPSIASKTNPPSTDRAGLARMFVGAGPLLPAPPVAATATASRARVSLPMLARPQPALAEVPAGAPRRSGESLRALFPDLFVDGNAEPGSDG